ncbi:MAG TPA: hypothetical protein VE467_14480, partial [Chryseolinea sp.]|nr:hypothetical protein [Chryseolinea sp.]
MKFIALVTCGIKYILISLFLLATVMTFATGNTIDSTKKELLTQLIKQNDDYIPKALSRQLTAENSRYIGAVYDADSIVSPIGTAGLIQTLMCSYVSRDSKFYKSKELLYRMTLAGRALLNFQHDDGTIDLLSTNFHSTPDLGFTIYPLALSYSILLQYKHLNYQDLPAMLKEYMLKAGNALSVGGIHTPNHRWVVSGALAWLNSFFPNPEYRKRVEQWLAERIDLDPDGQYHERSTAIYTPITNRTLLDVAKKMKVDSLYDVVRKNLNMTFYFVHSNGEIATESSNRQDKYVRTNMAPYYLAYNYMAHHDKNGRYSGMVNYIHKSVNIDQLGYMLPHFLEDPTLLQNLPEPVSIPTNYHKYFEYSDVVRIREGNVDMSIIINNPSFFTYFKGNAALESVRLSSSFFGKGQFESTGIEKEGDSYILSSIITGRYFQPLPKEKIPVNAETWQNIPRTEREVSEVQTLYTKIYITPEGNGKAKIKVIVDGPENLPVALELGFRSGGRLENVISKPGFKDVYLIEPGSFATCQNGDDKIKVGPGTGAHKWTQLRGALPKVQGECLYFTNYAPC